MDKPTLFEFKTLDDFQPIQLVEQVLEHGYVIFDSTRPRARELADGVNDILKLHGKQVFHLTTTHFWPLHYLLEVDGRYEWVEFQRWAEDYCREQLLLYQQR